MKTLAGRGMMDLKYHALKRDCNSGIVRRHTIGTNGGDCKDQ